MTAQSIHPDLVFWSLKDTKPACNNFLNSLEQISFRRSNLLDPPKIISPGTSSFPGSPEVYLELKSCARASLVAGDIGDSEACIDKVLHLISSRLVKSSFSLLYSNLCWIIPSYPTLTTRLPTQTNAGGAWWRGFLAAFSC